MYPHLSMPAKFAFVRARLSSPRTDTPFLSMNCMQLAHITSEASHGPCREPGDAPCLGVRWIIWPSAWLSNSIVNATSACASKVGRGILASLHDCHILQGAAS